MGRLWLARQPGVGRAKGGHGLMQAETPVKHPGSVPEDGAALGRGAVQHDTDQYALVVYGLEEQAFSRLGGPAGLDPDRARVVAEQQVRVLPDVSMMMRCGARASDARAGPQALSTGLS
jgi:hypothetical protein